jgi:hypothetical protein
VFSWLSRIPWCLFFSICQNDQWKRFSSGGWEENGGDSDAHVTERKLLENSGQVKFILSLSNSLVPHNSLAMPLRHCLRLEVGHFISVWLTQSRDITHRSGEHML